MRPQPPKSVRFFLISIVLIPLLAGVAEYGLRLLKSFVHDGGTVSLRRGSLNCQSDAGYGWFAPRGEVIAYKRPCFGDIEVTYNAHGQRLSGVPDRVKPEGTSRICVVGDSTTQAYQLSDGQPYYHLLETRLSDEGRKVELLPMAVGGFGTLQQAMLLKEFCLPYDPDLIVWQVDDNDLSNNSFEMERYGGQYSNFRRRPYWQDKKVVFRQPMILPEFFDSAVLRLINARLFRPTMDGERAARAVPLAAAATESILRDFLGPIDQPVLFFFSETTNENLRETFRSRGFEEVLLPPLPEEFACAAVGDPHRNAKGHAQLADVLEPVIRQVLERLGLS